MEEGARVAEERLERKARASVLAHTVVSQKVRRAGTH